MSRMSDLNLMIRDGERTAEDFMARGIDTRIARAMAAIVNEVPASELRNIGPDPEAFAIKESEGAFSHGPGCYGECDGLFDCSA